MIDPGVLVTDLYQLTMLQGYFAQHMEEEAVFEFFVRKLPENRGFLMAAGLEQLVDYLEHFRFTDSELAWLREEGHFTREFVDYLGGFRFTGDLDAIPEGTVCFPNEPLARIVAPLPEAQIVETRLINFLHFQTLIASKASRCVLAAHGKSLIDFGLRRAHGAEAGLLAARASYLAGFHGTATVSAGVEFGIPVFGTMAHSFIQAHDRELDAFEHFAQCQPKNAVLLIDTYDTERAAREVIGLAQRLRDKGITLKAVRLDSGDLAEHARKVRRILDTGGLAHVKILVSGNLDELALQSLLEARAPIDSFAIGTKLTTSADLPYLDSAYKLQEYAGIPRRKRSEGKATWPGRKQVYRQYHSDGRIAADTVTLIDDVQEGVPLLEPVMRKGKRMTPPLSLSALREHAAAELARLPKSLQRLEPGKTVPVSISPALQELAQSVDRREDHLP